MIRKAALLALVLVAMTGSARPEPLKMAVFEFELINTSTGLPATETEQTRLAMLSERLRNALDASSIFEVVDIAPIGEKAAQSNLQACGGCDRTFAEQVGADLSVTGVIHKMSELILNISIAVREVQSGQIVGAFNADIRSNTDDSWRRGLDWLLKHRILAEDGEQ
jgi:hypothetical protein